MEDAHAYQICKLGQMAACCKYLMMGASGFECAKINPGMKAAIDRRTDMHAKGDNCPGFGLTITEAGVETVRRKRCVDCGKEWADQPSDLCPGCEAYREHTGAI